ncbi:MAG: hypothetical protein JXB62_06215 [Pirellulales bacterium]|nr:hypothetical protein [Pirellulales bacterium]
MAVCPRQLAYRPLRVPREDGTALIEPPFDEIASLVEENVRLRGTYAYDVQGRSLAELAGQARRELLDEARQWTTAYRDVEAADATGLIFLAGHQPQLFHPGVWLKNFALGALARRHGAVAVNLLIDSDTIKETSLSVPSGSVAQPHVEAVAFDRSMPKVPYEQRKVVDRELFAEFGRRVAERLSTLVPDPMIDVYWPLAREQMRQTAKLGACLAQSRHRLEGQWGLQTLEIPQSRVCDGEPFGWFAAHLLARLPEVRETYNQTVREYRQVHRIRSAAHPVPDLSADGEWLESPLWVFSAEDPRRRPLFARRRNDGLLLSNGHGWKSELALSGSRDAAAAVEQLAGLRRRGVKIRSRALITTLWARLVLGDLFVHGIGGAKYDHVTDALIERLFGLKPPGFMILSGTLHLPIERPRATAEHAQVIRQQLRQLVYHPERYVDLSSACYERVTDDPNALVAAKLRWTQTGQTPQNARARCRAIRQINRALQPWVAQRREQLLRRQAQMARALQAENVLGRRDYGFCLYPERTFREFLRRLLPNSR